MNIDIKNIDDIKTITIKNYSKEFYEDLRNIVSNRLLYTYQSINVNNKISSIYT